MGILWRLLGAEELAEGTDSGLDGRLSDFTKWILDNLKTFMGIAMPIVLAVVLVFLIVITAFDFGLMELLKLVAPRSV